MPDLTNPGPFRRLRRVVSARLPQLNRHTNESSALLIDRSTLSELPALEELKLVAPDLPPELLIPIFRELVAGLYETAFMYNFDPKNRMEYHDVILAMSYEQQLDILHALRVNKAWNRAGTEILYQYPILRTQKSINIFIKTLKDFPTLRPLIRGVIVLTRSPSRILPRVQWMEKRRVANDAARTRESLLSMFASCTANMDSLIISAYPQTTPYLPEFDSTLTNTYPMGKNLRSLMLCGLESTDRPFIDSRISLPLLEILTIRDVKFSPQVKFPRFPKLHTLNIVQCTHTTKERVGIVHHEFPYLEHLAFYQNDFVAGVGTFVMRRLKSLVYLEQNPYIVSQLGMMAGFRLNELEEFTYGVSDMYESRVLSQAIPCPPKVQVLNILINLKAMSFVITGQLQIANKLQLALSSRTTLPVLKTINLYLRFAPGVNRAEVKTVFEPLKHACLNRGIELNIIKAESAFDDKVSTMVRDVHASGIWQRRTGSWF